MAALARNQQLLKISRIKECREVGFQFLRSSVTFRQKPELVVEIAVSYCRVDSNK